MFSIVLAGLLATTVVAGEEATYLLTVTNHGPSTARTVTVTDTLPGALTPVSFPPACRRSGATITCTLTSLPVGETRTFAITVRVDPGAEGQTIANLARTIATTADPDTANNRATVTARVIARADLSLRKTAAVRGRTIRYTLKARNDGPSTARRPVITDRLPTALVLRRVPDDCRLEGRALTCTLPDLPPGATHRVRLVATPTRPVLSLRNRARITSPTPDPDRSNNQATTRTTFPTPFCRTKTLTAACRAQSSMAPVSLMGEWG